MKEFDDVLARIRSDDPLARTEAWQAAAKMGAAAVKPLARLAREGSTEIARAAKRGLARTVRLAGAPGAAGNRTAVVRELLGLLGDDQPVDLRREILWFLSEIGGADAVAPIAALLRHETLREDARMALERIPGDESLAALRDSLHAAPAAFQPNVAQSLRARGENIDPEKFPSQKLIPTR